MIGTFGFPHRWTYFVDDTGVIRLIDTKVNPTDYGKTLAAQLEQLKVPLK